MNARLIVVPLMFMSILQAAPAVADSMISWEPPKVRRYVSKDKEFTLEITPIKKRCVATLFRRGKQPTNRLWATTLNQEYPPRNVLISTNGLYVVTVDDPDNGFDDQVIAIRNQKGKLISLLSLSDMLSWLQLNLIPRSVSHIFWEADGSVIKEDTSILVLKVNQLSPSLNIANMLREHFSYPVDRQYNVLEVRIHMPSGKVV